MGVRIGTWKGLEYVKELKSPEHIPEALMRVATEVRKISHELIDAPKHGRMRRSPRAHKRYRASAPGEPPASPTGLLKARIAREAGEDGFGNPAVRVGPFPNTYFWSVPLLLGSSRAYARPLLQEALKQTSRLASAFRGSAGGGQ
jgi:hypothetical protein